MKADFRIVAMISAAIMSSVGMLVPGCSDGDLVINSPSTDTEAPPDSASADTAPAGSTDFTVKMQAGMRLGFLVPAATLYFNDNELAVYGRPLLDGSLLLTVRWGLR